MIAEQLKKAVLQAAIQGKLTKQLPEDGDARDLLKSIGKSKNLRKIDENEAYFNIPGNWCWVRLGEILDVKGGKRIPVGKKLSSVNSGHKYIRVKDMQDGTILDNDIHYVPIDVFPLIKNYTISTEDVYITVAGSIGRVGTIPNEFEGANLTENADKLVFNLIDKHWLVYALQSPLVQTQIIECTTKVGQPKLAIKRIENLVISLPPLKEQYRIVETINKALAEINILKENETKLDFLQKSFPKIMKDSILQYAIQGKLTKQLPEDGDARDLLKVIQKEKARLVSEGKIKTEKPLSAINADEIPFDIPENWCWVRFGEYVHYSMGKTPSRHDGTFWNNEIPWVSISDMPVNGRVTVTKEKISKKAFSSVFRERISPKGTLIMSFKLTVGRVCYLGIDAVHNEAIVSIYPFISDSIVKEYMFKILPTISQWGHSKDAIKGKTLNSSSIDNLIIPIPPIAEQTRIVKRLDELLPICELL